MVRIARPVGIPLVACLLGAVLWLSLPAQADWQRVLQDATHGPVFAAVAVVLLLMREAAPDGGYRRADHVRAFGLAVLCGVATELAQFGLPDRSVSAVDVLHDAAGAALGLAAVSAVLRSRPWPRSSLLAVALLALTLLAWEPLRCARAYAERAAAYPRLAPLGGQADARFLAGRNATPRLVRLPGPWAAAGEGPALVLHAAAGTRPALELVEPVPDWRGHSVLAVDLTNPGPEPAHLTLRVLDAAHDWSHEDRFNAPVVVPPRTRTTVRVALEAVAAAPRGRRMDLARIANVMLFATRPVAGDVFYVSEVRLE